VFLVGVPVSNADVLVLATLVKDDELVHKLENAVKRDVIVIGLDDDERAAALKVLSNPPPGLVGVREKLVAERERRERQRERLATAESAA
jgi:hypothetical protein